MPLTERLTLHGRPERRGTAGREAEAREGAAVTSVASPAAKKLRRSQNYRLIWNDTDDRRSGAPAKWGDRSSVCTPPLSEATA